MFHDIAGIFSVYHRGDPVVEIWGGYADDEAKVPWSRDTLSIYCSTTKAVASIVLQMLAERGHIDYDAPVAKYWPEFAQNGKGEITVEQLVSHQAGMAAIDSSFSFFDVLHNPELVGEALAAQKPNWKIGDGFGYHAVTMGILVDQLIRRVDPEHRSLSSFFQEEIAEPFDIDFFIGLPRSENYRTARVVPANVLQWATVSDSKYWNAHYSMITDSGSLIRGVLKNPQEMMELDANMNNPFFREVPVASLNGFGTGASIAKLMGILSNGGKVYDNHLLTPESIQHLGTVLANGTDLVLHIDMAFGPGTMLHQTPNNGIMFGHPGMGGQIGYADPGMKLGWSYLSNHFSMYGLADEPSTLELQDAMYDCALNL